jgi:hypothetical protein
MEFVLDTFSAKRALERANPRVSGVGRKVTVTVLAIRPQLQSHGRPSFLEKSSGPMILEWIDRSRQRMYHCPWKSSAVMIKSLSECSPAIKPRKRSNPNDNARRDGGIAE